MSDAPETRVGAIARRAWRGLTVAEWRASHIGDATPACPHCGRRLGIRLGMWRENGRDAWLCDHDGEMENV